MAVLALLRHGESLWNEENRFTGWIDVPLTERGRQEALRAGLLLRGYRFDVAYTSVLQRAVETLELVMLAMGYRVPVIRDWHLNERSYGDLQGLNKDEAAKVYGEEQVRTWRRSYRAVPPNGESLEMTQKRVVPFFRNTIMLDLRDGKNVLVVAHGNSLRALVMYLEDIPEDVIPTVEIPTGQPIIYEVEFEKDKLVIKSKKVLS
ncbi:MAG: 2,3-bisphosphoglycerate-dependent phosphoglycerate mutase [Acidilobus sp.]|jgi:2,3-bisphosphoglycerate-dependent phosphoglycerate mutase|nr:2,3-bisphosphoglycerate-dependent phosphoglycerate mutase [Acidilobus sp.]